MKTQEFKNSESVKSSNLMMFVTMIIFSGILLFITDNNHLYSKNGSFNSNLKHENELLFQKMNPSEDEVSSENKTMKNPVSEIEFSMAKMQAYLIPEIEPELEVSFANSIVFPDAETFVLTADNTLSNDYFLKELQVQACEKTKEAVEYYTFEKKIRKYLTLETELPLKLEDWMINEKCWCTKLRETMALTEENKTPVKQ